MALKTLILVRHGKSSWSEPVLADFDRPLAKRGKRDAPRVGEFIARSALLPESILCSPAKRTRSTIKRIARAAGINDGVSIVYDACLYEADAAGCLDIVRALPEQFSRVMVCGHNPGLSEFCDLLVGCRGEPLPTSGVVIISFSCFTWCSLVPGTGRIVQTFRPDKSPLP